MLLPLSVMAMTPVSDTTLSDVTGQAGVNINADLMMDININTIAWGDSDGITATQTPGWTASTSGGYIGVTGFNIDNLRIKARENDTFGSSTYYNTTTYGTYGTIGRYSTAFLKPITIDVATGGGPGTHGAGVTFVRFGLGSLQISMNAMSLTVRLGTDPAAAGFASFNQILGTAHLGAMAVYINPQSYVDIYTAAGAGQGVNLNFNIIVDEFQLDYVSWEDGDGISNNGLRPTGASIGGILPWMVDDEAGFVGLANLTVGGPITIMGTVRIDVNSSSTGVYAYANTNHGYPVPVSVVHIGFQDNFTIDVGRITADVALGSQADLFTPTPTQVLGNIFIGGLNVAIDNGSWVDIWAH